MSPADGDAWFMSCLNWGVLPSWLVTWGLMGLCLLQPAWAQKPPDGLTYTCTRIVRDRAFNETIEKLCGFKGDVSERFKDAFKKRKCVSKVNKADDERIAQEVVAQTMAQKNQVGLKDFCLVHRSAYHNL
jgi:hypothetical protein